MPSGEAAISYHFRKADSRDLGELIQPYDAIPENRLGLDARFDVVVGFWFEGAWIHKSIDMDQLTNQTFLNFGVDYTFGLGNGLNVIIEHLVVFYDEEAFDLGIPSNFTALSVNYPIGLFDNLNAIFFYNWTDNQIYNYINWSKAWDAITLNFMGYWNPQNYNLPLQSGSENLYSGKGIQVLLVYNF